MSDNEIESNKLFGVWVSVKESLPELGEEVLVYAGHTMTPRVTALSRYVRYEGASGYYWENNYGGGNLYVASAISHWMALPAAPNTKDQVRGASPVSDCSK